MNIASSQNRLSVVIIAKDAEERIADCLRSVSFADEIIVIIDSDSSDKTKSVAESFGCKVFVEEWKGFDKQKNSAVKKCSNQWILSIDTDEMITTSTRDAILQELKSPRFDVYRFPRKNFIHGRWLKRGDFWPDWQIRLFKASSGMFVGDIHEKWISNCLIGTIHEPIEHFSFKDYADMVNKMNIYSNIGAMALHKAGTNINTFSPVLHGLSMFIKIYFLKMGFLDGVDGLVNAILKANGSFFKYAKLLELQRQNNQMPKAKLYDRS